MKKIVNPFKRSVYANTFAFHDTVIQEINVVELFEYIVSLCNNLGLEPTHMNVATCTYNTLPMRTYKREKKRILETPAENILDFSLNAGNGDPLLGLGSGLFEVHYSQRDKYSPLIVTIDEQFFKFEYAKTKEICKNIIEIISPNYAYMFRREFKKGPRFYPSGCLCGVSSLKSLKDYSPEAELITIWGNKLNPNHSQAYKTGDLRDIYPINMITDLHLNRHVTPTLTLRDLIEQSADNGRLEPLNETHYLWYVAENQIENVREKIRPSGIAIAI